MQTIVCRRKRIALSKLFYKYEESDLLKIEEAFGLTLQKYRTDAKLSQEQLAFNSSLDRTYISLLERGKRRPTINTVFALAQTVNIKPSILMQDIENILTESNYS